MSEFDQAFDPNILIGHCDLISRFSDFVLYLNTQLVYFLFFRIMSEYDQTFDPNILIGHSDLISRFSDFASLALPSASHYLCKRVDYNYAHLGASELITGLKVVENRKKEQI